MVICGICALGFESITDCDKHIETHKEMLLCPICNTLFYNKEELEEHSKSKHQTQTRDKMIIEEYQLICENCGRTFDTSQTLSKHTESEHGSDDQTKCNQCEFKTHNGKDLASHLLDKHGDNTEDIKCPHCDYKSINLDNIHEHIDKEHLELTLLSRLFQGRFDDHDKHSY